MQHTQWDHGLMVTAEGEGLAGHAGAVLLRKLAGPDPGAAPAHGHDRCWRAGR